MKEDKREGEEEDGQREDGMKEATPSDAQLGRRPCWLVLRGGRTRADAGQLEQLRTQDALGL